MLSRPRRPHQIRPTDPFLRWRVPQDSASAVVADGSCVAWIDQAHRPHPGWITSLGDDPETVALLVTVLHESHTAAGVTVPVAAEAWLGPEALGDDARYWSLWTLDPEVGEDDIPAVSLPPEGARIAELDPLDPRITALLAHSTSAYVLPGDARVSSWVGAEIGSQLACVAAGIREESGAVHLVSLCTDPYWRRRGLASAVCGELISRAREDQAPMVVLEMYSANDSGRATYESLGFEEIGRYRSSALAGGIAGPA